MKKNIIIASVCVIGLAVGATALFAQKSDDVIAKIGDKKITLTDYQNIVKNLGLPESPQIQEEVLDQIIEQDIIASNARKQGLDKGDDVMQRFALMQDIILRDAYLNEYLKTHLDDKTVRAEHEKRMKDFVPPMEYHAAHILVETEAQAKDIKAQLDKKADFSALAEKYSKDSNAKKGGDLGYFMAEMMVIPFADAVKNLKKDEISQPVKTDFGWHIIKLMDSRQKEVPPFEQVKSKLRAEMSQKIVMDHIEDLKKQAKIEKFLPEQDTKSEKNAVNPSKQ